MTVKMKLLVPMNYIKNNKMVLKGVGDIVEIDEAVSKIYLKNKTAVLHKEDKKKNE